MVRRGSTVRVRQRALQKRRTSAFSHSAQFARTAACSAYGAVYGAFASRTLARRASCGLPVAEFDDPLAQLGQRASTRARSASAEDAQGFGGVTDVSGSHRCVPERIVTDVPG